MIPKHKRIKLSPQKYKTLKLKVFERDKYCVLCGAGNPTNLHHVVFRSQMGSDTENNCVMLCTKCHELAHGVDSKDIRTVLLQYLNEVSE